MEIKSTNPISGESKNPIKNPLQPVSQKKESLNQEEITLENYLGALKPQGNNSSQETSLNKEKKTQANKKTKTQERYERYQEKYNQLKKNGGENRFLKKAWVLLRAFKMIEEIKETVKKCPSLEELPEELLNEVKKYNKYFLD